jgi:hypothetical protein
MTAPCQPFLAILFLFLCTAPQTLAQGNTDVPSSDIRVTLLGTGSGPRAFVDKAGISTLLEARGEPLLNGRGSDGYRRWRRTACENTFLGITTGITGTSGAVPRP